MASPAARLLAPGEGQPPGQAAFALFGKTGRSPRVYCCAARDAALKAMQVGHGVGQAGAAAVCISGVFMPGCPTVTASPGPCPHIRRLPRCASWVSRWLWMRTPRWTARSCWRRWRRRSGSGRPLRRMRRWGSGRS